MNHMAAVLIATTLVVAGGCFGGGSSGDGGSTPPPPPPPPPPPGATPGGLWSGAISWDPRNGFPGGALNVRALVAETGEFRLVLYPNVDVYFGSQNEQVFGTFDVDGGEITTIPNAVWAAGLDTGNANGDFFGAFGLSGDFEAGDSISGSFQAYWTNDEERIGTLSLNYHTLYESPSSLAILQGTYSTPGETLTIDDQGVIFYQSSVSNCTGNGTAEIIDPDFNMYRVAMEMGNCTGNEAIRNGLVFVGLATIGENNEPGGGFLNSTLEIAVGAEIFGPFTSNYVVWNLLVHED